MEHLGLMTPQEPRLVVQTLREAEPSGNTSDGEVDVDVDQKQLIESGGGDSLPDEPLADVPLPDVPLHDVSFPDVPLPDVPLPETRPDGSVSNE